MCFDLTPHLRIDNRVDLFRIENIDDGDNTKIRVGQGSDRALPRISSGFGVDADHFSGRGRNAAQLLSAAKQAGWPRLQSFCEK